MNEVEDYEYEISPTAYKIRIISLLVMCLTLISIPIMYLLNINGNVIAAIVISVGIAFFIAIRISIKIFNRDFRARQKRMLELFKKS